MAENTMKLEVITPERSFYTGDVIFVELNTTEGEVGIYARHIPMTMIIAPGVLTITKKAEERARKRLEAKSADIDIARAELALKRALVRKGLKA